MKISKLFHCLYAFLMFLPIVLFIPNAFYYGFNEHATNSETTTINYKYQSNEVNSYDDLVEGNIYSLDMYDLSIDDILNTNGILRFRLLSNLEVSNAGDLDYQEFLTPPYFAPYTYIEFSTDENNFISLYYDYQQLINGDYYLYLEFDSLIDNAFIIEFISQTNLNINFLNKFTYTDYNVIESVEINTNDTISNKMYQAWQSTWDLPLLQWTHTSFVAQPFTYITGLFGVPSDSTLNYIFAYFVSISICWLVFDLIMYLPNLAHRWLDRSAFE